MTMIDFLIKLIKKHNEESLKHFKMVVDGSKNVVVQHEKVKMIDEIVMEYASMLGIEIKRVYCKPINNTDIYYIEYKVVL